MEALPTADLGVLVAELCSDPFAVKNRLLPCNVKAIWEQVGHFAATQLLAQKGVALPGLGTFSIGPVLRDKFASYKRWRPVFALVEGRFSSIHQERSKDRLAGKAPVVQLNYSAIAKGSGVHRGLAQHVVSDMCYRLATHLLSGRAVKVQLPHVGMLQTAANSRLEFCFQQALLDQLDIICRVPATPLHSRPGTAATAAPASRPATAAGAVLAKAVLASYGSGPLGLQEQDAAADSDHLRDSLAALAPAADAAEVTAADLEQEQLHAWRPSTAGTASDITSAPGPLGEQPDAAAAAKHCGAWLRHLGKLCRREDKLRSGVVPRLHLEGCLYRECRHLLQHLDAATAFQLLEDSTRGKDGRLVDYGYFLMAFSMAAEQAVQEQELAAQQAQQQAEQRAQEAAAAAAAAAAAEQEQQRAEEPWQDTAQDEPRAEDGPEGALDYYSQRRAASSRAECDAFNRRHFGQLLESRAGGTLAPKVHQEPLNRHGSGGAGAAAAAAVVDGASRPASGYACSQISPRACRAAEQHLYVVGSKLEMMGLEEGCDTKLYPAVVDQHRWRHTGTSLHSRAFQGSLGC